MYLLTAVLIPLLSHNKHSTEGGQPVLETEMWGILSWGPTETAINENVLKMSCKSDFILSFRQEDKVLKGKNI